MTVRELSQLYYIKKILERDTLRLEELESRLQPGGMNLNGMPRNPSSKNIIEEVVPLIIDIKERILKNQIEYIAEQKKIESYIDSINDYQIRLILSMRFVDHLTWNQISVKIGGNNTEDSVKKMCYRFLKKSEKTKSCPKCPDDM